MILPGYRYQADVPFVYPCPLNRAGRKHVRKK